MEVPLEAARGPVRGIDVLVVEDEKRARQGLAQILRYEGFQVRMAKNGREAVAKTLRYRPAVVAMDIYMPGRLDGIEAAMRIQEAHPRAALFFVTAFTEKSEYRRRVDEADLRVKWFAKPILKKEQGRLVTAITRQIKNLEEDAILGSHLVTEEIERLYARIRDLVARSTREPEVRKEIETDFRRLRRLQEREAVELRRKFEERLALKPGEGWKMLEWAEKRLGDA